MKIFGEELRKSIEAERQQILQNIEDRNRRIEAGETDYDDCFISMRVSANALDACDKKLKILQGDGCMAFDAIFDENGDEVPIHYFENKWRKTTVVGRGVFASSVHALLKKNGVDARRSSCSRLGKVSVRGLRQRYVWRVLRQLSVCALAHEHGYRRICGVPRVTNKRRQGNE